ncbi:MAG: hypothetical protein ABSF03_11215 [Streptosporangiaceae bacterium]
MTHPRRQARREGAARWPGGEDRHGGSLAARGVARPASALAIT